MSRHQQQRHRCCLITFLTVFAVALFTLLVLAEKYLSYSPKVVVNDVSLTQFNSTISSFNSNTLSYNLVVNFTFKNPSRHVGYAGIYYNKIELNTLYYGHRLAIREVPGFYLQNKKENSNVSVVFKGERQLVETGYGDEAIAKYDFEKGNDVYLITMKLILKFRYKHWWTLRPRVVFQCNLKVPLMSNTTKGDAKFESVSLIKASYFYVRLCPKSV